MLDNQCLSRTFTTDVLLIKLPACDAISRYLLCFQCPLRICIKLNLSEWTNVDYLKRNVLAEETRVGRLSAWFSHVLNSLSIL